MDDDDAAVAAGGRHAAWRDAAEAGVVYLARATFRPPAWPT